jgi:2-dehydro-3-deoxygluconokinase
MTPKRILCLGEAMVELAPADAGLFKSGFAGDTFNTAWYAKRILGEMARVAYGTCIGTDQVSQDFTAFLQSCGIDAAMRRVNDRTLGLYMIALRDGERSFSYWRGQSAARLLADDMEWLRGICMAQDIIQFSGITLAILSHDARVRFLRAMAQARADGARIVFDTNMRPRLWQDTQTMCDALMNAAQIADIILPSFDEEAAHFDDATPADTIARYRVAGVKTIIVKNGGKDVTAWDHAQGTLTLTPPKAHQVDSTSAGDSFGAAVIAGMVQRHDLKTMLTQACQLASRVVGEKGALAPHLFQEG